MKDQDPRIAAASDLSSAAILASLIGMLGAKDILSDQEVREVCEHALFLLEGHQEDGPEVQPIYSAAREIIEEQLRTDEHTETVGNF